MNAGFGQFIAHDIGFMTGTVSNPISSPNFDFKVSFKSAPFTTING